MNVADLELCKELYELSGWGDNYHAYGSGKHDLTDRMWRHWEGKTTGSEWWTIQEDYDRTFGSPSDPYDNRRPTGITHNVLERCPAYDLGYLLRELPEEYLHKDKGILYLTVGACGAKEWLAEYDSYGDNDFHNVADTPENALCKLAIELFKQGIIKP